MTRSGDVFAWVRGTVDVFDDAAGWGRIRTDGGDSLFFHCTQIADGTRSIPVGVAVTAATAPIGLGDWEAVAVQRASAH